MKTPGPTSGAPTPATVTAAPAWRVGQRLQASVTSVADGRVTLLAGGRPVVVQTSLPLLPGQRLTLQVERLGDPPVLRLITPAAARRPPDTLAAAVRQLLPRQAPLSALMDALLSVTQAPQPRLAPMLVAAARNLLKQLGDADSLTRPANLRRAVEGAATPLESKLLAGKDGAGLSGDLRVNLLRLIAALQIGTAAQTGTTGTAAKGDARASVQAGTDWPRAGNPPLPQAGASGRDT